MIAAVKYMTCEERVESERNKLKAILARRGQFYEDEEASFKAYDGVLQWFKDEREERDRIELEAMEAEEVAKEEKKRSDPNYHTKKLFEGVKIKIPTRGMDQ